MILSTKKSPLKCFWADLNVNLGYDMILKMDAGPVVQYENLSLGGLSSLFLAPEVCFQMNYLRKCVNWDCEFSEEMEATCLKIIV